MKKQLGLLFGVLTCILFSCSSDDSDNSGPTLSTNETFNLTVDNEDIPITSWKAIKTFDNIEIIGDASDGRSFFIRFNENGVLDRTDFTPDPNGFSYSSSYYFPKHTFQIQNLSIDESNKIVNISCKGTVYEDDLDVFSPSSTLSVDKGEINVKFEENPNATSPELDTFIDAKIDGTLFESMKHATSGVSNVISYSGESDGKESLYITFDKTNIVPGTYDFSSSSSELRIGFNTSNPFAEEFGEFTEYETSGTLTIETFTPSIGRTLGFIKGTFELSATNDATTINITEGKFNVSFL